jgi:hypothetical protein
MFFGEKEKRTFFWVRREEKTIFGEKRRTFEEFEEGEKNLSMTLSCMLRLVTLSCMLCLVVASGPVGSVISTADVWQTCQWSNHCLRVNCEKHEFPAMSSDDVQICEKYIFW